MTWQYLSFVKGEHGRNRVVAGCLKTAFILRDEYRLRRYGFTYLLLSPVF